MQFTAKEFQSGTNRTQSGLAGWLGRTDSLEGHLGQSVGLAWSKCQSYVGSRADASLLYAYLVKGFIKLTFFDIIDKSEAIRM